MSTHDNCVDIMTPDHQAAPVTVGIDIGTTSVKALAVSEDGEVLARARVPHRIIHTSADHMEHSAQAAWRRGPIRAFSLVRDALTPSPGATDPPHIAGICVAGMVPSLTAVDRRGIPRTPGLLYGDARGRQPADTAGPDLGQAGPMPDAEGFLRWTAQQMPEAFGYWPAQAVANHALTGQGSIDTAVASTLGELHQGGTWNDKLLASCAVRTDQMPQVVFTGQPAGTLRADRRNKRAVGARSDYPETVVAGGSIDAFCDQIVAGANEVGDVIVLFGATMVVWVVTDSWLEVPGLWTVPHTVPDRILVGGPSNAGALFVDWARSLLRITPRPDPADDGRTGDPRRVPVWLPYVRGERVPFHDAALRAALFDLDITDGPAGMSRAAYEASGFVVRSLLERSGVTGRRIVASGGGTQVAPWMAGVADATGLPVDTVAVPEGAALGAAFLARMAAGLEPTLDGSRRWARHGRRVLPDPRWQEAADARYQRFKALGSGV
ncbi:MAG TPA: FGGY-family carbohydrate kinase [Acidimicrobiales bacterium]|jgi:xylulokinase|nr:FGGY-family carbohydrate kinase [Acidimicrobiales bacterium]